MKELYNLGISEESIKGMMELNPEIIIMDEIEIIEKEEILRDLGCNKSQILNIISSNSVFLSRTSSELSDLINYLKKIGFRCLNILFDSNPYILNLEVFEIKNYISDRIKMGLTLKKIVENLDSDPYLFDIV